MAKKKSFWDSLLSDKGDPVNMGNFTRGLGAIGHSLFSDKGDPVNTGNFARGLGVLGRGGGELLADTLNPGGRLRAELSKGKGKGKGAAGGAPTDYLDQYLGYFDTSGVDVNALKQYLASPFGPRGFNANDPNSVAQAISGLGLTPKFQAGMGGAGGSDPLAQQALFSQMIQPFLSNLDKEAQGGIANYSQATQNIDKLLGPMQGPQGKALQAMLGQTSALEEAGLGQSERAAASQAVTAPAIGEVLNTLRANYINQLNNLTTGGTSTTPARINAPTTATKVASALNPKIKAPA